MNYYCYNLPLQQTRLIEVAMCIVTGITGYLDALMDK